MRSRPVGFIECSTAAFFAVLASSSFIHAQSNPQQAAPKSATASAPAPKRDLTGVWQLQGGQTLARHRSSVTGSDCGKAEGE